MAEEEEIDNLPIMFYIKNQAPKKEEKIVQKKKINVDPSWEACDNARYGIHF